VIEKILKKDERIFRYGEVAAVNAAEEKVRVRLGSEGSVWIKTQLSLEAGDAIIVARSGSTWFVVQDSRKAMPSEKQLLSL
jgi:hypothetical protein